MALFTTKIIICCLIKKNAIAHNLTFQFRNISSFLLLLEYFLNVSSSWKTVIFIICFMLTFELYVPVFKMQIEAYV